MKTLAQTQRMLAQQNQQMHSACKDEEPRAKQLGFSFVKLAPFAGGNVSDQQYRDQQKSVLITQRLYDVSDSELAMLMTTTDTDNAKDTLAILRMEDLLAPNSLKSVPSVLDKDDEKLGHERLEGAHEARDSARRRPGQSMPEWIQHLKRLKLEISELDKKDNKRWRVSSSEPQGLAENGERKFCSTLEGS